MTLFLPKTRTKVVRGSSEPSVCHRSQGGWKSSYCSPLPVEGEIFFLTFPFIDQAMTQLCAFLSPAASPNERRYGQGARKLQSTVRQVRRIGNDSESICCFRSHPSGGNAASAKHSSRNQ